MIQSRKTCWKMWAVIFSESRLGMCHLSWDPTQEPEPGLWSCGETESQAEKWGDSRCKHGGQEWLGEPWEGRRLTWLAHVCKGTWRPTKLREVGRAGLWNSDFMLKWEVGGRFQSKEEHNLSYVFKDHSAGHVKNGSILAYLGCPQLLQEVYPGQGEGHYFHFVSIFC